MTKEDILGVLSGVVHPGSGVDIVSSGIVGDVKLEGGRLAFTLSFARSRDPFARSLRRNAKALVEEAFPELGGAVTVFVREAVPEKPQDAEMPDGTAGVGSVIAVASGKGGVGKSTVTANLAVMLARRGFRVGLLDADIYGPSQPKMFGVEGCEPEAEKIGGRDMIRPVSALGVKLMSIGFFIGPDDALVWRGAMATNALRQLIHQTSWGELDYLLIDMPPGTGDVHLTVIRELKVAGAVIVSTPQQVAVADVLRGIRMFQTESIDVPVLGIIENMAWFTPAELPDNRYHVFGRGGAAALAGQLGLPLLGEIPLVQSVAESGDGGVPAVMSNPAMASFYERIAQKIAGDR